MKTTASKPKSRYRLFRGGVANFRLAITSNHNETAFGLNHEMVFVAGCTFQMGSNIGEIDEKPVHAVTLSDFLIGKCEVTQKQWWEVMGNNPSYNKNCDHCPVEQVSLDDVQEFVLKLNQKTGKTYRLPTEAEWEYAARGGNKSRGYTYRGSNSLGEVAWYGDNSGSKTNPVGNKKPNELGLYDMSGNVWEWCSDWYWSDYYQRSKTSNPIDPTSGSTRVSRGGGWGGYARDCRASGRDDRYHFGRIFNLGFRLVVVP